MAPHKTGVNGNVNGHAASENDEVRQQVLDKAKRARHAGTQLRTVSTEIKNRALHLMADKLVQRAAEIISANEKDIEAGARVA